jgi:rsbT co-antagonist protein RsbR
MIDSARSAQVMTALLDAIQKESAAVVIIDVTGVPLVDTNVANHILKSARAAALLGASCILEGISPQIAQTIVQLGMDLQSITTRSNLQAGFSLALSLMHLQIKPMDGR